VPVAAIRNHAVIHRGMLVGDLLDVYLSGEDIDDQHARGESNDACAQFGVVFHKPIALLIHCEEIALNFR
jgi:hypothetical protein